MAEVIKNERLRAQYYLKDIYNFCTRKMYVKAQKLYESDYKTFQIIFEEKYPEIAFKIKNRKSGGKLTPNKRKLSKFDKYRNKKKREWLKATEKKLFGYIYLIELFDDGEVFLKIGVTTNPKSRFEVLPYEVKPILLKRRKNLDKLFDLETEILKYVYREKYNPIKEFGGQTECFEVELKSKVLSKIKEKI